MAKRPTGVFKNDNAAVDAVGAELYAGTPKSVFALVAFNLAMRTGDDFTEEGARKELCNEIEALAANQIIAPAQARAAINALTAEQSA